MDTDLLSMAPLLLCTELRRQKNQCPSSYMGLTKINKHKQPKQMSLLFNIYTSPLNFWPLGSMDRSGLQAEVEAILFQL